MKEKPYVIVIHKSTGRAFSMNRRYEILESDLGIIETPTTYVEDFDCWLPTFGWQRPFWVKEIIAEDIHTLFHAYWLY